MRIAVDSNVILYAEGLNDDDRREQAKYVLSRVGYGRGVAPIQALGECYSVLVRKGRRSRDEARACVELWSRLLEPVPTGTVTLTAALALSADGKLQFWDSVILAAAAEANCAILLSEDMQDGFSWRGVTIVNPFKRPPNPLLATALGAER